MDQWHFAQGGQQQGPVSEDEMRQRLARGELAPADLVWKAGMPQWIPAGQVAELLPPGATPMPMPPPIPAQPVGYYVPTPPSRASSQDQALKWIVPVGRSGSSIVAGYLGLFSLICGLLAPFAIIVSIVAIKDLRKNPSHGGMGRAVTGLVLGILVTLAWLVLIGIRIINGRI